jgi:hypothetical protein
MGASPAQYALALRAQIAATLEPAARGRDGTMVQWLWWQMP